MKWLQYLPGYYTFKTIKDAQTTNLIGAAGCVAILGYLYNE